MSGSTHMASALMTHAMGLHARPSVKVTKLAKGFAATIELAASPEGPWIDAKSIVRVMALRAAKDTVLYFRATGKDAAQAVEALAGLVERDFDEDHTHAASA